MTRDAGRGLVLWLLGWSQILNLIENSVTLKCIILILTPSLLNGFDQWIALVLLHCHRNCNHNNCWQLFAFVAPRLISDFASYWEFGDVLEQVQKSQMDLLTTQRLWSMDSPCLYPLSPQWHGQQTLKDVWVCGSKSADMRFCILLWIRWRWSVKFSYWLPHYSTAIVNG